MKKNAKAFGKESARAFGFTLLFMSMLILSILVASG